MQKGSALLFVVIIVVVLVMVGGLYFYQIITTKESSNDLLTAHVVENKNQVFTSDKFEFVFEYPKEINVKEDSEEEFNKRGNGDFRKNFAYYVTYQPAEVLGIVAVLNESGSYEMNPFMVWVFENPDNLTVEKWYLNYWYYPFVWGDYTERRNDIAPTKDATVSGQVAKYGTVSYQPGEPKFLYLKHNGKMYLIRIINKEDKSGDQILSTFKFQSRMTL